MLTFLSGQAKLSNSTYNHLQEFSNTTECDEENNSSLFGRKRKKSSEAGKSELGERTRVPPPLTRQFVQTNQGAECVKETDWDFKGASVFKRLDSPTL